MPEPFRSFASIFASGAGAVAPAPETARAPEAERDRRSERTADPERPAERTSPVAAASPLPDERVVDLIDGFTADLTRLRARAAECLERAAEAVIADLAARVLGRELLVAPPALEAMLDEALREFEATDQVVVRVSGADAGRLAAHHRLTIDPALGPGDFALDTDEGRYDATLQTRLEAMLSSHRVAI